jgi:hypothetical protein
MNQASNRYQSPLSSHVKMELLARSVLQVPCLADDTWGPNRKLHLQHLTLMEQ